MGKLKRDSPSFADVGQRCKRAMTPDPPISAKSLPNRPSPLSVWGFVPPALRTDTPKQYNPMGLIQEH